MNAKTLKVPEGFRGAVLSSTDQILPRPQVDQDEEEDAEDVPEVGIVEEEAEFDEVMVWGHETLPDDTADPYVRGIEEWIAFAQQVGGSRVGIISTPLIHGRFIQSPKTRKLLLQRRNRGITRTDWRWDTIVEIWRLGISGQASFNRSRSSSSMVLP